MFVNIQYAPGQVAPQANIRERTQGPFLPEEVARLQRLVSHHLSPLRLSVAAHQNGLRLGVDGPNLADVRCAGRAWFHGVNKNEVEVGLCSGEGEGFS